MNDNPKKWCRVITPYEVNGYEMANEQDVERKGKTKGIHIVLTFFKELSEMLS